MAPALASKNPLADIVGLDTFTATMPPGFVTKFLEHEKKKRTYYVHVPPHKVSAPLPLLILLHGAGCTPAVIEHHAHMIKYADKAGYLLVEPAGLAGQWNDGRAFSDMPMDDDCGFIEKMITQLQSDYSIDRKRIYAVGMSNGGFFAQYLAVKNPGRFAAIASVVATMSVEMFNGKTAQALPILYVLSTADPLVPFAGGRAEVGFEDKGMCVSGDNAVQHWVKGNNCEPKPTQVKLKPLVNDGTSVERIVFKPKLGGAEVVEYLIKDGGHAWPGPDCVQYMPPDMIGKCCHQFDASQVIIEFFNQHRKP